MDPVKHIKYFEKPSEEMIKITKEAGGRVPKKPKKIVVWVGKWGDRFDREDEPSEIFASSKKKAIRMVVSDWMDIFADSAREKHCANHKKISKKLSKDGEAVNDDYWFEVYKKEYN